MLLIRQILTKVFYYIDKDSLNIPIKIKRMNDVKYEVTTDKSLKQNSTL